MIQDMGTGVGKNEGLDQATERPLTGSIMRPVIWIWGSACFPVTRDSQIIPLAPTSGLFNPTTAQRPHLPPGPGHVPIPPV
jgi:hypothetical protein